MWVIGLMSGTSADGIDAALCEFSGAPGAGFAWRLHKHITMPYADDLRDEVLACVRPEGGTVDRLCALNVRLGQAYAAAAIQVTHAAKMQMAQIDVIGCHGQTVWHMPGQATLQLGEPAVIAEQTGANVVSNFRARDIAAGGQGAPLVAFVDALLLTHETKTRAAQNIGGIANVTYLPRTEIRDWRLEERDWRLEIGDSLQSPISSLQSPFAFDTGPGNMLIDDAVRRLTNGAQQCDLDGAIAARGQVNSELFEELMDHPFLHAAPPKTTGREQFGAQFGEQVWRTAHSRRLCDEDVVATLTMFTAFSIAQAYQSFLPTMPDEVIVSGGGARNATLMRMLQQQLEPRSKVLLSDEVGIPSEAKEALAFAVLAYETVHGRPSNLPTATGAKRAVVLGDVTFGVRRT
jgi:anhydro-N-acetylmuramic acid kinase